MAWIFLLIAGLGEIGGVIFLKISDGFKKLKPTLASLSFAGISFYFLSLSLRTLPVGTSYAIWTGMGAVGTVLLGMILFQESKNRLKFVYITCIICGIAGLKIV